MANPYKGEFLLEVEGKSYTLTAGVNTLAAVEGLFSTPEKRVTWQDVVRYAEHNSFTHIRGLIWAMTRRHHRELSVEDVGDLMDRVGLEAIDRAFNEATQHWIPNPEDVQALGGNGSNPPKAQGVNGAASSRRSTSRRAKPV